MMLHITCLSRSRTVLHDENHGPSEIEVSSNVKTLEFQLPESMIMIDNYGLVKWVLIFFFFIHFCNIKYLSLGFSLER